MLESGKLTECTAYMHVHLLLIYDMYLELHEYELLHILYCLCVCALCSQPERLYLLCMNIYENIK